MRRPDGVWLVLLAFAATAWVGLRDGPAGLRGATNAWELALAAGVTLYGLAAPVAAVGLWRGRGWALEATVLWAIGGIGAAAIAGWYYTPATEGRTQAVLGAGLGALLIGLTVTWYVGRRVGRSQ